MGVIFVNSFCIDFNVKISLSNSLVMPVLNLTKIFTMVTCVLLVASYVLLG